MKRKLSIRRYSNNVTVYIDEITDSGVFTTRVSTPEGCRRIEVVVAPRVRDNSSVDINCHPEELMKAASAAISFAMDDDERRRPALRGGDDISVGDYAVFAKDGDAVMLFTKRTDSPGQTVTLRYCGRRHDIRTGKPVGHKCHEFPVEAVYYEGQGRQSLSEPIITAALKGEPLARHSVVYLDEHGKTIQNISFRLWFPDGPKMQETLIFDTARRARDMLEHKIGRRVAGQRVAGIEIVSEKRVVRT